jgi:hypothetical protein
VELAEPQWQGISRIMRSTSLRLYALRPDRLAVKRCRLKKSQLEHPDARLASAQQCPRRDADAMPPLPWKLVKSRTNFVRVLLAISSRKAMTLIDCE